MKEFFVSSKFVIIITLVFILFIIGFNIYDIAVDKSDKFSYTAGEIESLEVSFVNINTADKSELSSLPGVSDSTAQNIIDYREKNGDFESVYELQNVKGIGEKLFLNIRPMLTV